MVKLTAVTFDELIPILKQSPIIARLDPLITLVLPSETKIVRNDAEALGLVDDPDCVGSQGLIVQVERSALTDRFPTYEISTLPSIEQLNRGLAVSLDLAREHLLTNHNVAARIETEIENKRPSVVAVVLIDGLSYEDTRKWGWSGEPCLIDGPSVTYRFQDSEQQIVQNDIGFAAIVGNPSISHRLSGLGFQHFRGFTYWQRGQNRVSDRLFDRVQAFQVQSFSEVLDDLQTNTVKAGTYVQIVRQGLDGLAHSKRELGTVEIDGALLAIRQDIEALVEVLGESGLSCIVYVTADHGMLWKREHSFEVLDVRDSKPRYTQSKVPECLQRYSTPLRGYSLFHYPFLGTSISANHAGVHGGLSYLESIVPFIRIEV